MSWKSQQSSRLGRSIVTAITSGTVTQATTPFAAQTYQVRVVTTLPVWASVADSTATDITANSSSVYIGAGVPEYFAVTAGQKFKFLSTSTSSGYVSVTEMT